MYKIILFIMMLTMASISWADDTGTNWEDTNLINSDTNSQTNSDVTEPPTTTTFSVEIPNDSVGLVITALCDNNGFSASADQAKQVVIQYINDQVKYYNQRMAAKNINQQDIPIQ